MSNSGNGFDSKHRQNHHQVEVNHLRQKYLNLTKQLNQKGQKGVFNKFLGTSHDLLQKFWNYVVPKFIRGNSSEFQAFRQFWYEHEDQEIPLFIQRESLWKITNSEISDTVILALCYAQRNFKQIKQVINRVMEECQQRQIKVMIFPIAINGQYFKSEFQSKLQYKRDSILLLHTNIFEQLVVLDQVSTDETFYLEAQVKTLKKQTQLQSQVKASIFDESKQNIPVETGSSTTISIKLNSSAHKKSSPSAKSAF